MILTCRDITCERVLYQALSLLTSPSSCGGGEPGNKANFVYDGNLNSVIGTFVLVHTYIVRMDPQFRACTNDSAISEALQVRLAYALRWLLKCSTRRKCWFVCGSSFELVHVYAHCYLQDVTTVYLFHLNTPQACWWCPSPQDPSLWQHISLWESCKLFVCANTNNGFPEFNILHCVTAWLSEKGASSLVYMEHI